MIVGLIISSTHSNIDSVFFVDGKEEDQLPDAPEGNRNNSKDDSTLDSSSSASGVFSEEVDHLHSGNCGWNKEEESNENKPPWKVFIQKLEECEYDQDKCECENLDSNEQDSTSDW